MTDPIGSTFRFAEVDADAYLANMRREPTSGTEW
jgi:hypothetical protein